MGELKQDYYSTDIRRTVVRPWDDVWTGDRGDDKETEAARSSQNRMLRFLSGSDKEGRDDPM